MNIVFDLDGTLIDSKFRLYALFQKLVPTSSLTYEEYWNFKQNKVGHEKILSTTLGLGDAQIREFLRDWMDLIESPEFLALDSNIPGMPETLARLRQGATLHVCTARQFRDPAIQQLARLNLLGFFDQVLVTGQQQAKNALIATRIADLGPGDWMIGDTGKDIEIGKSLKMRTCAVLSGFLNRSSLMEYGPDLILPSAAEFHI